jgi:hypothetical protein
MLENDGNILSDDSLRSSSFNSQDGQLALPLLRRSQWRLILHHQIHINEMGIKSVATHRTPTTRDRAENTKYTALKNMSQLSMYRPDVVIAVKF